ncbi:MAG: MerR family transcriptional regulator [Kangiellaceae bacterium]
MNENTKIQDDRHTTFSISELSKEFGITPRSIRYYESEGLISPERQGSQRIYHRGDRIRLQLILRGKRVGFSLSEIREIINLYDSPSGEQKQTNLLYGKIEERRNTLYQQQKDIETMLLELDQLENRINPGN